MGRASRVGVGFTLQPEAAYLDLLGAVIHELPDYYEVVPETTWKPDGKGGFAPNGYHQVFGRIREQTGRPFVAHGVGFSLGSARRDPARDARWLKRLAADQAQFEFRWYTDHLGVSVLDGRELTLPLALPYDDEAAAVVEAALGQMQAIVPDVGFENTVFYFHLGDPLDEPAWMARALGGPGRHLLLDLHNVYTTAVNVGFDPWAYIDRLPLERVIELHVSGGNHSEASWLPSGRVMRLDSHDHGTPEEVWALLDGVLPRCPNLRGVTLERMEGTVEQEDVAQIREELRRVRRALEGARVL
jgi:uncharacterized protein